MSDTIHILDTTLREGEQAAGVAFSLADKVDIARRLCDLGVHVIEAGFPAVSESELDMVRRVARVVAGASVSAVARATTPDIEMAARALAPAATARIHIIVPASVQQIRMDDGPDGPATHASVLDRAQAAVQRARGLADEVELTAMDATRAAPAVLAELAVAAVDAGASTVNLADTVGCALPGQITEMFTGVRRALGTRSCTLSFHGHDDLGLAHANALAAVGAGARQVETTVHGIGERAGNTPLEELLVALRLHGAAMGVSVRTRTDGLYGLCERVATCSRMPVAHHKSVVGRNAYRHVAEAHQDGVLRARDTYQVVDPAWISHPRGTEIVLGKLSGRAGFVSRIGRLGFEVSGGAADAAFSAFRRLALRKREVDDHDLRRICREAAVAHLACE